MKQLRQILLQFLAFSFFLHLLRVFIATVIWNLDYYLGSPEMLACYGVGIFALTLLAPLVWRSIGSIKMFQFAVWGLILARLCVQFVVSPLYRSLAAGLGIICFLWIISEAFEFLTESADRPQSSDLAIGIFPVAVIADSILRCFLHGYDIVWRNDIISASVTVLLSLLFIFLILIKYKRKEFPATRYAAVPGNLITLGPWLFLAMCLFQNPQAVAGGALISDSQAAFLTLSAAILGSVAVVGRSRFRSRAIDFSGALLLLVAAVLFVFRIDPVWVWGWIGTCALFATAGIFGAVPKERPSMAYPLSIFISFIIFIILIFVNGEYKQQDVMLIAAVIILLAKLSLRFRGRLTENRTDSLGVWIIVLGFLLMVSIPAALLQRISVSAYESRQDSDWVKVMTYNIHQGFDADYIVNLEAIAETIANEAPDIICLQEVNRAQISNGMVDCLGYLAHKLNLFVVYGPNHKDGQYGNAILSRYPISAWENYLFKNNIYEQRGILKASIVVPWGQLTIYNNHLDFHPDNDIRVLQVMELIEFRGGRSPAVICGDMNATPHSEELQPLYSGDFYEVSDRAGMNAMTTYIERLPEVRGEEPANHLDYHFLTNDLTFRNPQIIDSRASDHKPVVVEIKTGD